MSGFCIHYHRDTGTIRNWGDDDGSEESFAGPDYAILHWDEWQNVDPARHRIDVARRIIVDKSPAELAADQAGQDEARRNTEHALRKYLRDLLKE